MTFVLTFVLFGIVVLAMALGVLLGGRRLRGSCGGSGRDCSCGWRERRRCALPREPAEG